MRGRNGVIMAQPSLNPDGKYHWEIVGIVPELPQELVDLLPISYPDASCHRTLTLMPPPMRRCRGSFLITVEGILRA